jgi:hypothetical protein
MREGSPLLSRNMNSAANLAHFSRYLLRFVSLPRDGAPSSSLRLPSCWAEGVATPFFTLSRAVARPSELVPDRHPARQQESRTF